MGHALDKVPAASKAIKDFGACLNHSGLLQSNMSEGSAGLGVCMTLLGGVPHRAPSLVSLLPSERHHRAVLFFTSRDPVDMLACPKHHAHTRCHTFAGLSGTYIRPGCTVLGDHADGACRTGQLVYVQRERPQDPLATAVVLRAKVSQAPAQGPHPRRPLYPSRGNNCSCPQPHAPNTPHMLESTPRDMHAPAHSPPRSRSWQTPMSRMSVRATCWTAWLHTPTRRW